MPEIDDIVRRLAEVTDALLALDDGDFAAKFALETERDALRAQAEEFHQSKDEGRPTQELEAELVARKAQFEQIRKGFVNRMSQSSSSAGRGGGGSVPLGRKNGGNVNNAISRAQGTDTILNRIAEIEQELARRDQT